MFQFNSTFFSLLSSSLSYKSCFWKETFEIQIDVLLWMKDRFNGRFIVDKKRSFITKKLDLCKKNYLMDWNASVSYAVLSVDGNKMCEFNQKLQQVCIPSCYMDDYWYIGPLPTENWMLDWNDREIKSTILKIKLQNFEKKK